MPKSRKTREQKFHSDLRKQRMSISQSEVQLEKTSHLQLDRSLANLQKAPVKPQLSTPISTSSYAYLAHDLWKTFFLTLSVVALELFLRFFVVK